jgi:Tfp pilus assembly protein PilF
MAAGSPIRLKRLFCAVACLLSVATLLLAESPKQGRKPATTRTSANAAIPPDVLQAEKAIGKGDLRSAEKLLLAAVARDPKEHRAWYDLAYVYRASGRDSEAISSYQKALAQKPDLFDANYELGLLLLKNSKPREAAEPLRKAAAAKPEPKVLMALGEALAPDSPDEAVAIFGRVAAAEPKNPQPHLQAALIFERKSKNSEAEREYNAALLKDPSAAEAVQRLTSLYSRTQRYEEAETLLRAAVAKAPAALMRLELAHVLVKQGKSVEAASELDKALKDPAVDSRTLNEAARIYATSGRSDDAIRIYRQLLREMPQDAGLHFRLAMAHYSKLEHAQAEPEFIAALQLDPKLVEAYGNLAVSAQANKHHELAIKALDARAQLVPDTPATYFLRATSYDHLRLYKEAAAYYHRFLEAAGGKFPDQEWQARHRLKAIEPEGGTKR